MKTRFLCFLICSILLFTSAVAGPRDSEWQEVERATQQGLPQTAIAGLELIFAAALREQAYPEAIKAIGRKIALEAEIQGGQPEESIVRMQAELEKAPAAMKPVMETILAHWYWQYFQQNRGRFFQRTQTAVAPGEDLQTWDLARILAEIDRHFTAALADEATLKKTPIGDYDELLEKGSAPDVYRPTLFDFIAYEALEFYQAGEQAARAAEDAFEIEAGSPIFADATEFVKWTPASTQPSDAFSPKLNAITLYQSLMRFHEADKDRSAFHDADLARLVYGDNVAVGENKDERYQQALEGFIERTARHEISARARALLASRIHDEGEPAKAREVAQRGLNAFPKSVGGAQCFNLIQQIEAPSARLETEQVWNAPWPTLDVAYRNVTKVYFRAFPANFEEQLLRSRWGYGGVDHEHLQQLLGTTPALAWEADLPMPPLR